MNIKLVKSVGCLMLVALGMVSVPASATLMVREPHFRILLYL